MGKPASTKATTGGATSAAIDPSDVVSLHTNPGSSSLDPFRDDAGDDDALQLAPEDDLPPSYSDSYADATPEATSTPQRDAFAHAVHIARPPYLAFREEAQTGNQYYIQDGFEDPVMLERHITALAAIPPRPYVQVVGTHTHTTRDSKGKTEQKTVVDFDVSVELTPFLYADPTYRKSWAQLRTVDNGEKVRRGTVVRKRAPGVKYDLEVGGSPKPTLKEWCHRYSASSAGLKCFALQRRMVGFDERYIKEELGLLVRNLNYRGHVEIRVLTKGGVVECYNTTKINRWRLTTWVQWLFTLTLLFIFTWPFLFFATKRWEVAVAEWPFSRMAADGNKEYVSMSEQQWYNMWGRAIARAILLKRQATLDQQDLARAAEEQGPAFDSAAAGADANNMERLFRAGLNAMNEVNRHMGWGEDC